MSAPDVKTFLLLDVYQLLMLFARMLTYKKQAMFSSIIFMYVVIVIIIMIIHICKYEYNYFSALKDLIIA
jgi:hypothetical protein